MKARSTLVALARALPLAALLAAVPAVLLGAAGPSDFRFSRKLEANEGWTRIDLPDDVLATCRPGLPDLRVLSASGTEVAYALQQSLGPMAEAIPLRDVESKPDSETSAIVDRSAHPAAASFVTVDVAESDFLKPVVIEASDDKVAWREIARGSVFATARARMTTLRFAPNDRRWWRLRFDDRNGARITPRSVVTGALAPEAPARRELPLSLEKLRSEAGTSVYTVALPHANMALSSLRFAPDDAAFSRRVTLYERVFFRDEVERRRVGGGRILRSPSERESLDVPLGDVAGNALEIEIDDGSSPPLALQRATVTIEARSLLVFARAADAPLSLAYGALNAEAPRYDLAAALALGRPSSVQIARIGDPVDRGAPPMPIAPPPRGPSIDVSGWSTRAPIVLPPSGSVAYLALDDLGSRESDLRIVDSESRQVPYLFERTTRHAHSDANVTVEQRGGRTVATIRDLAALQAIDGLTVAATEPAYFTRQVTVVESTRDARGVTGERTLGGATWERRPGDAPTPLEMTLGTPSQPVIEVRIENGDNAPIALGAITVARAVRRVDFVFAPGDALSLLRGNQAASSPSYDLSLFADRLLSSPAQAAQVGPPVDVAPKGKPPTPPWFWAVVIAAGLVLALALSRTLRDAKPEETK